VLLGNAFGIPGIAVDTHVHRVSRRIGLTKKDDPVKIEFDLMEIVPRKSGPIFQISSSGMVEKPVWQENPSAGYVPFEKSATTGPKSPFDSPTQRLGDNVQDIVH